MADTKIDWADKVWNPVTGCTKVSAGCKNCYAERMAKRLAGRAGYPEDGFKVTLHPEKLFEPLRWKKPSRIFVCSMGDLFHEDVSDEFLFDVTRRIVDSRHTFLILTKRPARMAAVICETGFIGSLPNVWFGVSVEDQETADERIPLLLEPVAEIFENELGEGAGITGRRFVSYEPALGPIDFTPFLKGECKYCNGEGGNTGCPCAGSGKGPRIDWLIMGGESGPGARPMHPDWARSVRDQCKAAGVPFFFKQWGEWAQLDDNTAVSTHENTMGWAHGGWSKGRYGSHTGEKVVNMIRAGKSRAGCLLDGKEHKETPHE